VSIPTKPSGTSILEAVQTIAAGDTFYDGMVVFDDRVSCIGQAEGQDCHAVFQIEEGGSLSNIIKWTQPNRRRALLGSLVHLTMPGSLQSARMPSQSGNKTRDVPGTSRGSGVLALMTRLFGTTVLKQSASLTSLWRISASCIAAVEIVTLCMNDMSL
jgi:hypothetical protein